MCRFSRRTLGISLLVTLCTLVLGYPVAFMLATLPQKHRQHSDDLRAAAVLDIASGAHHGMDDPVAGRRYVIAALNFTGITWLLECIRPDRRPAATDSSRASRTVLAMTHIQLPFTLLPIYSVMKTISPTYMRAAKSLGRDAVPRLPHRLHAADHTRAWPPAACSPSS